MHETDDMDEARGKATRFMSCRGCCTEPLFVKPMQENARQAARAAREAAAVAREAAAREDDPVEETPDRLSPEQFLLGEEMGKIMRWCGNTPPLLCISLLETFHALVANRFKSKGFHKTGPVSIVQDTLMTHWKRLTPNRMAAEVAKLKAKKGNVIKVKRKHQYAKPHSMIGQVNARVKKAVVDLGRQRVAQQSSPKKLGAFLHFEQCRIATLKAARTKQWSTAESTAIRLQIRREWFQKTKGRKQLAVAEKKAAVALRPRQPAPTRSHTATEGACKTPFNMGSRSRPVAEDVLDKCACVLFFSDNKNKTYKPHFVNQRFCLGSLYKINIQSASGRRKYRCVWYSNIMVHTFLFYWVHCPG